MQTKTIIPNRHFESTVFGSFTQGVARDVPANYAAHFVEAGVADYAPATLSDLAAEVLARAGIASGQESAPGAAIAPAATEVTSDAEKAASGPENASADAAAGDQVDQVPADQASGQADQVDQGAAAPADQAAPAAPKKRKTAAKEA